MNWRDLLTMRKWGQRPADGVWLTDHHSQRSNLEASGGFALMLPADGEEIALPGLEVRMLADRREHTTEAAQRIAGANPKSFVVFWRGEGTQCIL